MIPIVELRQATKDFRGIPAFSDVNFALGRGEIHALLGENGAGKSTLTKVIAGVYPLSSGTLLVDVSTAVQNPATRRRKTRPGGSGLRHGARAYQ